MQAEQMSQEKKWLDVETVGAALGMSALDSSKLADILIDADWLTPHPGMPDGKLKVRMTKTGFDEVAKLRLPWHQKWIDKNPKLFAWIIGSATGTVMAIIGAILIEYLKHHFWPAP